MLALAINSNVIQGPMKNLKQHQNFNYTKLHQFIDMENNHSVTDLYINYEHAFFFVIWNCINTKQIACHENYRSIYSHDIKQIVY